MSPLETGRCLRGAPTALLTPLWTLTLPAARRGGVRGRGGLLLRGGQHCLLGLPLRMEMFSAARYRSHTELRACGMWLMQQRGWTYLILIKTNFINSHRRLWCGCGGWSFGTCLCAWPWALSLAGDGLPGTDLNPLSATLTVCNVGEGSHSLLVRPPRAPAPGSTRHCCAV